MWPQSNANAETTMSDEYYKLNNPHPGKVLHRAPENHMLHPKTTHSTRLVPARDRYRASQTNSIIHDVVEDDDQHNQDEAFDEFGLRLLDSHYDTLANSSADRKLLQQPYEDRKRQATQDRARLSLAPGPSKFANQFATLQSQLGYPTHASGPYEDMRMPVEAWEDP